jgi:hypothetical protein
VTLVETLVASGVTASVMAGVLAALGPAQRAFVAHAEAADARQRLRVCVDALTRDLLTATAVDADGSSLTIRQGTVVRVYYLSREGQLRQDDGPFADAPVADGLAALSFESLDRRVRVRITAVVRAGPDLDVVFDVAPRNALPE